MKLILIIAINFLIVFNKKKPEELVNKIVKIDPQSKECFVILVDKNINLISILLNKKLNIKHKIYIVQHNESSIYKPKKAIYYQKINNHAIKICIKNNNMIKILRNIHLKIYNGEISNVKAFAEDSEYKNGDKIVKNLSNSKSSLSKINEKAKVIEILLKESKNFN